MHAVPTRDGWQRLTWPAVKLSDGTLVRPGDAGVTPELLAAVGAVEVVDPGPDHDPATQVVDTRALADVDGAPIIAYTYRDKTAEELAAEAFQAAVATNTQTLTEPATIEQHLTNLKAFLADADAQRLLDRANNTAPSTSDLNRELKTIVRQLRRQANMTIRLSRVSCGQHQPELLADVSDVGTD